MADERRSRRFCSKRWTARTRPDAGSHLRGSRRPAWRRAIAASPPLGKQPELGAVHQYPYKGSENLLGVLQLTIRPVNAVMAK